LIATGKLKAHIYSDEGEPVAYFQTTIQRLFRRISAEEIETAFRGIFLPVVNAHAQERGTCAIAIDGKAQKGRLKCEVEQGYPVHAVSLVEHQRGIVLTQGHVEKADVQANSKPGEDQKPEEKKQKSELAVASRLIQHIDWKGKMLTGDALYCQRSLCATLRQAGGDYLFLVKGNQPQLLEDIRLLFAPLAPTKRAGENILRLPEHQAQTAEEKGHGRVETRSIRISSELKGYSDWPGLEQVFEIRRCWQSKGVLKEAVLYGVTSLPARAFALAYPQTGALDN
jgi:predicted transposase YbfD/YdcC